MDLLNRMRGGLSANTLKMIALVSMVFDHVGLLLLDDYIPFRVIGRIAFPVFAYLIAEGCRYTRNRARHFLEIFLLGVICQIGYFIARHDNYMCVLLTFSMSVIIIYSIQCGRREKKMAWMPAAAILAAALVCYGIPACYPQWGIQFDYGFFGAMLPVFVFLAGTRKAKFCMTVVGIVCVCLASGNMLQWWSLLSLIPLILYNGERGSRDMKYFFYIFYPAHMVVISLIAVILHL